MRIEITSDGFCVANTGQPFRASGVRSLMAANTSDKPGRRALLIGAKGLGFRALLNWSNEPFITSGALEICFAQSLAKEHVSNLAARSSDIAEILAGEDVALPVLAFPTTGDVLLPNSRLPLKPLIDRARILRSEGYDTVVAAAFTSMAARTQAIAQADEFKPRFLLFVEALDEIEICIEGREPVSWRKNQEGEDRYELRIKNGSQIATESWICRRRADTLVDGSGKRRKYELAVAIRTDEHNSPSVLHSYFPTDIPLPFPALFHATLELDSNRKALNAQSELNAGVLRALGRFYADVLLTLSETGSIKEPLDFLSRRSSFLPILTSIEDAAYEWASALALIPTMGGKRVAADATRLGPPGYQTYFPVHLFAGFAFCRGDDDRTLLLRLKVGEVRPADAIAILRAAELTVEERATAIVGIAKYLAREHHDRRLLIDASGLPLQLSNICFPPPVGARPPALPRWARAKFIDNSLWEAIAARTEGTRASRVAQLSGFGMHEFGIEGVITSLRRQAAATLKRGRMDGDRLRRELILALYGLFSREGRHRTYPAGLLEVRCADGQWRDAREVHFSGTYGQSGRITAALYATQPKRLLADAVSNGLPPDGDGLTDFLRWIGISEWPRETVTPVPESLRPLILHALPKQFEVHDTSFRQTLSRDTINWTWDARAEFATIVGLDAILTTAPSGAILAWLALDPRLDAVTGCQFKTTLEARNGRANHRHYHGPLPDIMRETIASSPWLRTAGGRAPPRETMIAPGRLSALFDTPSLPSEGDEKAFGLTRALWLRGLLNAGVPGGIGDLGERRIYQLLGSLEARDAAPELVRRVYAQVLELDSFEPSRAPDAAEQFKATNSVLARKGGELTWVKPREAYYLDRDNVPLAARDLFALIELPPRRNSGLIYSRFGVAALSKQRVEIAVASAVEEEGAAAAVLRTRFEAARPYIRAFRSAHTLDVQQLKRLDQLSLRIVKEAQLEFRLGEVVTTGPLEPWRHLLDGNTLIVAISLEVDPDVLTLQATQAVADGLAEVFELQSGADFALLLERDSDLLRSLQLRRMLSDRSSEEVDSLLSGIEAEVMAPSDDAVTAELLARATTSPTPPASQPEAAAPPTVGQTVSELTTPPSIAAAPIVAVTATPVARAAAIATIPTGHGGGVGIRIGGPTGPLGSPRDPHRPADAEAWASLYEEQAGRFPLPVSRLQGRDGFGCDCLSFLSETDRAAFQAAPSRRDLVARFVEVKSGSGSARLEPNEMDGAERYRERYFIYRINFEPSDREWATMTIVANPLAHSAAIARECDVRVDDIPTRETIRLQAVRATANLVAE